MAESINATRIGGSRLRPWQNAGAPSSGTSGTLAGYAEAGAELMDTTNGVKFVNEGTRSSPYWTPTSFDQRGLFGVWTDFRDQAGAALAGTAVEVIVPGSGLRIFGQGIDETDAGLVVQTAGEGGSVGRLTTTDEAAHTLAIGMEAGVMQPDQHQLLVVDVELTNVSAITERALFVGFLGTAADALDPAVTGATTTATLVQDDLAGVWFDSGLSAAARLFGVHNKSDEAATQALATDGDTGVDIAAAGTFQRLRVEINAGGDMVIFVNKAQVYSDVDSLDADEEVSPVVYLESNAASVKTLDVRRFATWAYR